MNESNRTRLTFKPKQGEKRSIEIASHTTELALDVLKLFGINFVMVEENGKKSLLERKSS